MILTAPTRPMLLVFFSAIASPALAGCVVEDHHFGHDHPGWGIVSGGRVMSIPACPSGAPAGAVVSIDTGAGINTEAGRGTGVFAEYETGGHWHVFATCDTTLTGYGCGYDVTVQALGGSISNVTGEELEITDAVGSACAASAYLSVDTTTDFDGLRFDAPSGSPVRLTAALDGALHGDLVYWVGSGVARHDARVDPVDLAPTAP